MLRIRVGVLASLIGAIAVSSLAPRAAAVRESRGHNAFFRPPVNASRSPFPSRLARTSPRSLVSDPAGRAYLFWVETLSHTQGIAHELALAQYFAASGWDTSSTPVARWEGVSSTEPAAVVDPRHVVHLVWLEQESTPAARQVMAFRFDASAGVLSPAMPISDPGRGAADPAIAVDPEGRVHVVWSEMVDGQPSLRHRQGDGARWGEIGAVPGGAPAGGASSPGGAPAGGASSPGAAFSPDIACDPGGGLHLVWTKAGSGTAVPMYVRRAVDGRWGTPESLGDARPGWFAGAPVVSASEESVWVAWTETDGREGRLMVRCRTSSGWSSATSPSRAGAIAEQPSAALDPWGTLHLVWRERRLNPETAAIAYTSRAAGDTAYAVTRSLTAAGDDSESPIIAADSSGRVLAAWVDRRRGEIVCRSGVAGFAGLATWLWYRR